MAAQSFGRRGVAPALNPANTTTGRQAVLEPRDWPKPSDERPGEFDASWSEAFDLIPIATLGFILFFVVAFGFEWKLALGTNKDGSFDHISLVAFGAASFDRVIGAGEWWRVFLAPLLHASVSHQVGNCFALFFVAFQLERMVGRWWLMGLFALSAIGGLAGSLLGNPHTVVTVGASGAITGLIGALFVISFRHKAGSEKEQRTMRRTALFFGVPALAPLAFGASGHVDYHAHAGGALTGALLALLACLVWPPMQRKPGLAMPMGLIGSIFFGIAGVACFFAVAHSGEAKAEYSSYLSDKDVPPVGTVTEQTAIDLVAHYPNDPRAHYLRGAVFLRANRLAAAEYELKAALNLARDDLFGDMRDRLTILLALIVNHEGRHIDAKDMMVPYCGKPITRIFSGQLVTEIGKICICGNRSGNDANRDPMCPGSRLDK